AMGPPEVRRVRRPARTAVLRPGLPHRPPRPAARRRPGLRTGRAYRGAGPPVAGGRGGRPRFLAGDDRPGTGRRGAARQPDLFHRRRRHLAARAGGRRDRLQCAAAVGARAPGAAAEVGGRDGRGRLAGPPGAGKLRGALARADAPACGLPALGLRAAGSASPRRRGGPTRRVPAPARRRRAAGRCLGDGVPPGAPGGGPGARVGARHGAAPGPGGPDGGRGGRIRGGLRPAAAAGLPRRALRHGVPLPADLRRGRETSGRGGSYREPL
ncbi:MAG: Trans-aconitate 2-methyltransferase, partial [uncultured Arthrobacter sp.]